MLSLKQNIKYVVWGTGMQAAQFSYINKSTINIEFYIDNNMEQAEWSFWGKG